MPAASSLASRSRSVPAVFAAYAAIASCRAFRNCCPNQKSIASRANRWEYSHICRARLATLSFCSLIFTSVYRAAERDRLLVAPKRLIAARTARQADRQDWKRLPPRHTSIE